MQPQLEPVLLITHARQSEILELCYFLTIIIVISLKQSLPNAYAWSKKTKIQGTIQNGL